MRMLESLESGMQIGREMDRTRRRRTERGGVAGAPALVLEASNGELEPLTAHDRFLRRSRSCSSSKACT